MVSIYLKDVTTAEDLLHPVSAILFHNSILKYIMKLLRYAVFYRDFYRLPNIGKVLAKILYLSTDINLLYLEIGFCMKCITLLLHSPACNPTYIKILIGPCDQTFTNEHSYVC